MRETMAAADRARGMASAAPLAWGGLRPGTWTVRVLLKKFELVIVTVPLYTVSAPCPPIVLSVSALLKVQSSHTNVPVPSTSTCALKVTPLASRRPARCRMRARGALTKLFMRRSFESAR